MADDILSRFKRMAGLKETAKFGDPFLDETTATGRALRDMEKSKQMQDEAALVDLEGGTSAGALPQGVVDENTFQTIQSASSLPESILGNPTYGQNYRKELENLQVNPLEQPQAPLTLTDDAPKTKSLKERLTASLSKTAIPGPQQQQASQASSAESDPYGPDLNDAAIEAAQRSDALTRLVAGLGKAATQIGSGIASLGAGQQVQAQTAGFDEVAKGATKASDLIERRKLKDYEYERKAKQFELQQKKDRLDPNSERSKRAVDFAATLFPSQANVFKNKSEEEIDSYINLLQRKEAIESSRAARAGVLNDKKKMQLLTYGNNMEKDEAVKKANNMVGEVGTIRKLIREAVNEGGPALSMLGPKVAKGIAGEVGVLTEQDVTRYVTNPQVAKKYYDLYTKWSKGKLSKETGADLEKLADIMELKAKERLGEVRQRYVQRASKTLDLPEQDVKDMLDPSGSIDFFTSQQSKKDLITVQTPDGKFKLIPKDKLDAAVKAGGKVIK